MANFQINDGIVTDHSDEGWAEFKKWLDGTYAQLRYVWVDEGSAYSIAAIDGKVYRTFSINKADATEFEAAYKANAVSVPTTTDGKPVHSVWPTEGSRVTVISPNWCDPTTWYYSAAHVGHDTATPTTSGSVYQLTHSTVIDTNHGKITGEDNLLDSEGRSFRVMVSGTVSGTDYNYTEVDPHTGAGDYTLDYDTGEITFSPALAQDATVMACYHRENGSTFVFSPTAGKSLMIKDVEVQFSEDIDLTDSVLFQAYGPIDVFAPYLLISNGGPYPSGTKIPLKTTKYKTMIDFVNEANGALPAIPKLGGESWRGLPDRIHVFPWRYQAMTALNSSIGMEVHIKLEHDIPFGGSVATATFYCLSEDE